ncbi:MAG: hypothetical protein HYY46_05830 [Deltaproteobacteria bacterium]|nr:hypothetical protein [Deltaproteobacteria bacterium]
MPKHLIDTDLYIDLIQTGKTLPIIRDLYDKEASGVYFSSVVAQELLAGPALQPGEGTWKLSWLRSRGSGVSSRRTIDSGEKQEIS